LLEKYDNKLDELQEDNELKDMKIFEYERVHLGDRPHIHIESIEDKVKFLVQVLGRLRDLYIVEAKGRIEEQKKNAEGHEIGKIKYPVLPSDEEMQKMSEMDSKLIGKDMTLEQAATNSLQQMQIIETNREIRESLGANHQPPQDILMKQKGKESKRTDEKTIEFVDESMGNDFNDDDVGEQKSSISAQIDSNRKSSR